MNKTKKVLIEMLTENTGRHFLDSGSAYGRNWERNQGRDFESEPECVFEFSRCAGPRDSRTVGIEFTLNVFHWLANRVEYCEDLDEDFKEFCEGKDTHPFALVEDWLDELETDDHLIDGDGNRQSVNTYNGEDALSQTLQYTTFEHEEHGYCVALSIHGGCDVRGGYTYPRIFQLAGDGYDLYDNARGHMGCDNCDATWYTDDTCNWYPNNGETKPEDWKVFGFEPGQVVCDRNPQPHDKHTHGEDALCNFARDVDFNAAKDALFDANKTSDVGTVLVAGGKSSCPECHEGTLSIGSY